MQKGNEQCAEPFARCHKRRGLRQLVGARPFVSVGPSGRRCCLKWTTMWDSRGCMARGGCSGSLPMCVQQAAAPAIASGPAQAVAKQKGVVCACVSSG